MRLRTLAESDDIMSEQRTSDPVKSGHYGVPVTHLGEFVDLVVPPITECFRRSEPVIAIVSRDVEDQLRERLGEAGGAVSFHSPHVMLAGPVQTTIRNLARVTNELIAAGPTTIVSHYQPWTSVYEEALRESLANIVFASTPLTLFCGCPETFHGPATEVFHRGHPAFWSHPGALDNPGYCDPTALLSDYPAPPPEPLRNPDQQLDFDRNDLRTLRRFVVHHGISHGLDGADALQLAVAANEVATNSIMHGAGRGRLAVWRNPDQLIWEVRDSGQLNSAQFLGMVAPGPGDHRGRGLWLARQIVDDLYIWHDQAGTGVRATVNRRRSPPPNPWRAPFPPN